MSCRLYGLEAGCANPPFRFILLMENDNISDHRKVFIVILGGFAGWISLIGSLAFYIFGLPHAPGFAPEIGPFGSFIVFSIYFSLLFFGNFVLVGLPFFLIARSLSKCKGPFQSALVGAILFSFTFPVWVCARFAIRFDSILFGVVLGFISGFVSFLTME